MRAQQTGDEQWKDSQRPGAAKAVRQPRPGGGTPAESMLSLQRLAGNAAVSRAVEEQRHAHTADCGHTPPVQRSTEPSGSAPVVQRMQQDELHQHPPGPALRVRGPRKSRASDRTPNALGAAEWDSLPQATRDAGRKQRVDIDADPQKLQETDPLLHYNLGAVRRLAPNTAMTAGRNEVLEGMGRNDPGTLGHWNRQDARDRQLGSDARAVRDAYTETPEDRQQRHRAVEETLAEADSQDAMGDLSALLARYEGVAIGGTHSGARIWQFLCTHMEQIQAAGVRTLYLESIRDDSYQSDVDAYLAGADMHPDLQAFVTRYDNSMNLGTTGLGAVLEAARTHSIRVKGLDGRPARRPLMSATVLYQRVAAMNTYATQVVTNDRRRLSATGGYLMELGSAHTGTHKGPSQDARVHGAQFQKDEGFPGVDDLLGIPAVGFENDDRFRRLPNS
ncbi:MULTISPECIES: hypothetical protein [Streptomyces]|uniref:Uncharacterized protein n=1 Tax=Streptomyces stelliscabiei TaxID=146820 RepID=A0A8I0PEN9_9ACTN|nr:MULTISPECIES: hypothetical protein [Streptomyces]MBE1602747.1 hypothetical protein [Streptomyces stelliscabiei]MDX2522318.1 hypothetical protein [Streptomyces stelliscabiei]MDX2550693.1 hypothetical protein [Streptomyces stelliscabiei]MDX2610391.1 hypothetical protein [Streptomyces stelliscabiei]MDX2634688.1 hypothetical protein [Streptomyces stelliscabiei]